MDEWRRGSAEAGVHGLVARGADVRAGASARVGEPGRLGHRAPARCARGHGAWRAGGRGAAGDIAYGWWAVCWASLGLALGGCGLTADFLPPPVQVDPDPMDAAVVDAGLADAGSSDAGALQTCVITGCAGDLCESVAEATSCAWRPEYGCFAGAVCARRAGGCDWVSTAALDACLEHARLRPCGGILGTPCPSGQICADDPRDACEPAAGGADCGGLCVEPGPVCGNTGGGTSIACPETRQRCVDDPRDACGTGSPCPRVCVRLPEPCGPAAPCPAGQFCTFDTANPCGAANREGTCVDKPSACRDRTQPVCGCDNQTYPSACKAAQAGVAVSAPGVCG